MCVPEDKCSVQTKCNENEEFSDCGTNCGQQCSDLSKKRLQCPLKCEQGCFCKTNYYRDGTGKCIPKSKCIVDPLECPDNEEYNKCGSHCGQSCEDLISPVECPIECDESCFCRKGFYRNIEGFCVNKTDCDLSATQLPTTDCPLNEVFKDCGNKCDESCDTRTDCKPDCEMGCFCQQGELFRTRSN